MIKRLAPVAWIGAALLLAGCNQQKESATTTSASSTTATSGATTPAPQTSATSTVPGEAATGPETTTRSGLKMVDLKVGEGTVAENGSNVSVNYTGWLTNGTQFDSSIGRGPFTFRIGAGQVIPGWDEGVKGMRVGGKRKLTIPPDLGYGASGAGGVIPPNATLVFDVELLDVK
jgi:FKBP-type peptidyl-prolyl cis-trans isomerase